MTKAMWKGTIVLGNRRLDVKLYSAVEDRSVRFRMLHQKDLAPVEQHIIRKDTGEEVEREDIRKAFAVDRNTAVILKPEELEKLVPADTREIHLLRFVAPQVIDSQWYDRPYYLGPDGNAADYFALARALEKKRLSGIAHWVMRKKRYVGALMSADGYLALATMRRADQVLAFSGVEPAADAIPRPGELKLAEQLVAAITADFDPALWQNEHRKRLLDLIEAKASGKTITPIRRRSKPDLPSLTASLKASIAAAQEKKVA